MKWKLPGYTEPGFLQRRLELTALMDAEPSLDSLGDLLDFLEQFVDAEDPRQALLQASQAEYSEAIIRLLGYGNSVKPPKEGSSGQQ